MAEARASGAAESDVISKLADAAARAADGPVGVVSCFDSDARIRAQLLLRRLADRGVAAVEVPAAALTGQRPDLELAGWLRVTLLVDPGGGCEMAARQFAARLGAPLLTLGPAQTCEVAVLGVHRAGRLRDVAVSSLVITPGEDPVSRIGLRLDGVPLVCPRGASLRVTVTGELGPPWLWCTVRTYVGAVTHHGARLVVKPAAGGYAVIRDGQPVEDLTEEVEVSLLSRRLRLLSPDVV